MFTHKTEQLKLSQKLSLLFSSFHYTMHFYFGESINIKSYARVYCESFESLMNISVHQGRRNLSFPKT